MKTSTKPTHTQALPPGQYALDEFPRFGLNPFAGRFPKETDSIQLKIIGEIEQSITISDALVQLPRVDQVSDFHCVTTWSCRALTWSGFRFSDLFETIIKHQARPLPDATFIILRGQDGYRASLPLDDLLADDVLLADRLNGEPLTIEHGAPLRLVAPAHYGYKNTKHLNRVEFCLDNQKYKPPGFKFMEHPRARVAFEERARGGPGWLFRYLYRPLVRPTISRFREAMEKYNSAHN